MAEHEELGVPSGLLIGGAWRPAADGRTFDVMNPATGERLTAVADGGREDAVQAVDAAAAAFAGWRDAGAHARSRILRRWFELMIEDEERLARLMTLENGKPLQESRVEVHYAASFVEWFAEEGKRAYGRTVAATNPAKRITVLRQPVGVVAAITPWNFPAAMITRKLAPALAAGCTVVLKPAEQTPLTALRLAELLQRAGAPRGVLNVVSCTRPAVVADAWLEDARVRKVTFTGSTEVGKELMRKASGEMQRLSLELGGQAPFIVYDDADLDIAVEGLLAAKFRNAGQTCIAANRVLVAAAIEQEFVGRVQAKVAALKVGNGLDAGVTIGPMIDERGRAKVLRHVDDAVRRGARLVHGGGALNGPGFFVAPTLLAGVDASMQVMHEETFGPVIAVATFASEAQSVALANATPFGLAAYFFTRDAGRAWRVAEALDYGIVGVNDGAPSTAQAPFGGYKQSGFGREGGTEGLDAFLETKYLSWGAVGVGLEG